MGTLLAHDQLAAHQDTQVLLHRATVQEVSPQSILVLGVILPQV